MLACDMCADMVCVQVFVSDENQSFSISAMKADYERMIAEARLKAEQDGKRPKRKTAAEMSIDISADRVWLSPLIHVYTASHAFM